MTGKDKVSQIEFKFDDSVPSYVREQLQDPINRINQHIVDLYSISNVIPRTVEITSDPMRANSPRLVEVDKITGKALYENPRLGGLTVGNKIYIAVPPLYGEVKQYPYSFLHEFRHVTVPGTAGPNDPHYASWYDGLIEMERILNVVPHDTDVMYSSQPDLLKCFTGDTSIQLEGGNTCYIRDIRPGDIVLAYDSRNENRYNSLVPRRVTHLFNNITTEWVVLTWQENDSSRELTCTPGHHFLDEFGNFPTIADILKRSGGDEATIVLADGQLQRVSARRIVYSAETAHLYERASKLETPVVGGLALSPIVVEGWATYNFEVEDLHTYVAGGVRVHNTSNPWTHESTKEKKDVAVTEAAIRHGVPEDYAIALGKGSLGVEELGGSSGSGVTKGSNSSTSGGGLVSYSTSGRAISLDRQTYDSYISSHGGDRATANSRVEAAVTAAVAAGKSYKDAMAAGMGEARAAGLGTSDWSTSRTAENAYNAAKEAAAKQQKTQSSSTSGSSGKGSGSSANTAPSGQTSGSGSSSSGSSGKGSGGSGSNSSSSPSSSGSGSSGGSSGKGHPVLLDLDGDGFDVTRLDQSSVYFDIGGDGYKHRTAWAGAGDGVLMVDADGDGVISNRKEVIFTDWDPTADSDIEALRQVFDTDKNGVLDASDADWSKFKVMVTRPDGTTVAKTMAELGIRSIKLTTDETRIALSDGSSIDGVTSYTKTDGSTGQAATATLMVDSRGYAVSTTSSTDGAGAVTVTSKALTSDGSLAEEIVRTTTADGLGVTTRFDSNGDGVIDRVLTDVTTVNADGSRQRVETNKTAAGVLIDKITTATSADRKTITIDRDKRGGGWTTERETQVTGTDNSLVVTLAALAPSASTIAKTTTTMSADRLLRSVAFDLDGNGTTERTTSDQTVINSNGSRVETESVNAGTGALLAKTVTSISADGQSRTETIDSDGDGLVDLNVASSTVTKRGGDHAKDHRIACNLIDLGGISECDAIASVDVGEALNMALADACQLGGGFQSPESRDLAFEG